MPTNRINTRDLEGAIFSSKSGQKRFVKSLTESSTVTVFTLIGKHDYINDDGYPILENSTYPRHDSVDGETYDDVLEAEQRDEACAKKVIYPSMSSSLIKYFIKRGAQGRMFNPIGLYDEAKHTKQRIGEDKWVYREVNKKVFEFYLNFLKTRNTAYLTNAEREVT